MKVKQERKEEIPIVGTEIPLKGKIKKMFLVRHIA